MADSLTEGLKRAAPHWSLAGDKQLLDVLQGLHQKIIEKCQETNRNLEKMVTALDEASIHLQNVNNKFSALSNSQFIESRVYDDDGEDQTEEEKPKEQTEPKEETEFEIINRGLKVLERMHESVTILCDSDSECGSDDEDITRVVLKPKDLYADRPLPYIIGSKAWKAKWHAGLLPDESDSDSASVKEMANNEEYSDSETEPISEPPRYDKTHTRRSPTISSSSAIESEEEIRSPNVPQPPSQSDVAAELARRLGGAAKMPDTEPEDLPPSPAVRKVYKPHKPAPGNVFFDEPPPIDSDQSVDEDDIFAEINKKQPYRESVKADNSVADDLFGRPVFDEVPPPIAPANQKQLLFEDESEPELFASEKPAQETKKEHDVGVKKPVGAMSLFGSNANAESIGAAILKRNQRKSSTSGEESDQEPTQTKNNPIETPKNTTVEREKEAKTQKEKERDIFEDLFAKSERMNKEKNKNNVTEVKNDKEEFEKPEKKPDLFSDIFDDIDDIFTTNVKVVSKDDKKQQKSIFDDDDLFAEVTEPVKHNKKEDDTVDATNKTNLFVDEDDIFSDKHPEIKNESKDVENKISKETKSLFDDSDDDLFSVVDKTNKNVTMSVNVAESDIISKTTSKSVKTKNVEKGLFSDDDDLFKNKSLPSIKDRKTIENSKTSIKEIKTDTEKSKQPSKEENILFSNNEILLKTENNSIPSIDKRNVDEDPSKTSAKQNKIETETSKQTSKVVMSPDIFEEDDDGLFLFQPTQSVSKNKPSQSHKDLVGNKLPENIKNESMRPEIKTDLKQEDEMSKSTKSIFSDEDTEDDIFSKPLKSANKNENNIKTSKEVDINRPMKVNVRQEDETKVFNNLNQTVIESTISTTKPKISEKPVPADVTVISTKTTVVPNYDTDCSASQDAIASNTTAIDSKITRTPEIYSITAPNVTINEVHVSTKPGIAQKPIVAKKPLQNEELSQENIIDDKKKDIHIEEVPTKNEEKSYKPIETKTDLFDDIFNDQPPVFEKPKEPKKSKNINALFDDDSDDESLFFKKNDVIADERPEGFISSDDKLFGLFMDEPPAIDVDFVQKPSKTDRLLNTNENNSQKDNVLSKNEESSTNKITEETTEGRKNVVGEETATIDDDDIFGNKISKKTSDDLDTNSKDLFSNIKDDEIFINPSVEKEDDLFKTLKVDDNKSVKEDKQSVPKTNDSQNIDITDNGSTEPKKVGKLKPMNLNINVNTLLPGASPKKVIKISDRTVTDGQTSSRSNDELYIKDAEVKSTEIEPTLVKSVSFEGNPDSSVLDNKFSKERVKIQVKRRPSTRRARKEAVKKSGIDFGEDSTDNSSSVDDQSKSSKEIPNNEKVRTKNDPIDFEDDSTSDKDVNFPNIEHDAVINIASSIDNSTSEGLKLKSGDSENNKVFKSQEKSIFDSDDDADKFESDKQETKDYYSLEQEQVHKPSAVTTHDVKDVKSKVVYILNDEDIFDTKADQKSEASESISKLVDYTKPENISDPDDLFKSSPRNEGITTLGQVYDSKRKTQKLDVLSDSDDDNLFKSSKTVKDVKPVEKKPESVAQVEVKNVTLKSKTKKSAFDDSDDDLFKGKTQDKSKKMPSLFGSDSDEELFTGVKKAKEVTQKKKEAKTEETRKQVKKASLFEDDGNDDLFGVKTKKNEDSKLQGAATKKKEETSKQPEPVFADPLSLLDYDEN